jgi:low temperature requirement protein LtrA
MKFRKDLIIKPRLFPDGDESSEKHADWLELLFDLIFVAAVSQLALNISGNYSFIDFIESIPLFFAIWWGWVGHTFFLSRFGTDDVLNRVFTMAQMVVVAFLTINVKYALGATGAAFAISYAVLRFMLVAEYLWVGKNIPETRPLTNRYAIGFGAAATLWFLSAFIPTPWRFLMWGLALSVDILTPITTRKIHLKFPPHPTHLPERFGLFTIILIGEAIVSVVFAVSNLGLSFATGLIGIMGFIIAFSIWWGYFEESRGAEERVQEKGDDIAKYQLWLYSHFPLLLGIVGTAAGIKHVISHDLWSQLSASDAWMLCISLAIALLSLSTIFLSSFDWNQCINRILVNFRAPYYLLIVLVICTGFLGSIIPGSLILLILTILCILKVIFSFREPPGNMCEI